MVISGSLFIFILHFGCSVVHSAFPTQTHETVSFETQIERNIQVNNHSDKPNVAETAPMICPVGFGCGYQIYNQTTRKTRRFVEYCTCPENSSCIKVGDNLMYHLYYYQCKKDLEDTWMPTHSSTTELPDVLDSGKFPSDMQDCTEDYMNRAYTTPKSTVSSRSNKIVQQSGEYSGIYRIYLFVPQNQEQDVESSDRSNNEFEIPTSIPPDSVTGSSLDKITESSIVDPDSKWESSPLQSSGEHNALNSVVSESSSDGDVAEATYKIGADAGTAVNVQNSEELSLDNPVSNVESTTVALPLGKNEL